MRNLILAKLPETRYNTIMPTNNEIEELRMIREEYQSLSETPAGRWQVFCELYSNGLINDEDIEYLLTLSNMVGNKKKIKRNLPDWF